LAASVEAGVHHPLAEAIVADAARRGIPLLPASVLQHAPGRGAGATVDGHVVRIGRPDWVQTFLPTGVALPDASAVLSVDAVPVLALDVADHAREGAGAAVSRLRTLVDRLVLLSGDHEVAVARLAGDVDLAEWRSRLLPDEKAALVGELASAGPVLMVGDGINDGPALAAASVGLAIADSGNAVAMEAADGALMHRDLALVPYAIALGRATLRTVHINVVLALALKLAVIVAAGVGVASLWLAVLADVGASLLVVALSLRLLSFEPPAGRHA
jgi:Cd2+/Zn2+-exporting ATPase